MKNKQLTLPFATGLGKLPANLYTEREKFIIKLWEYFVKNGAIYNEYRGSGTWSENLTKGYYNTLPNGITFDNLPDIIEKEFGYKTKILKEQKVAVNKSESRFIDIPKRIEVQINNTQFITILPTAIADLVVRIAGEEALKVKTQTDESLSPKNTKLMDFLKPFASKDDIRPALTGVNFDETGVCATDGHLVCYIIKPTKYNNIYGFDGKIINERFPQYKSVIPAYYTQNITFNVKELSTALKQLIKYTNKVTHAVSFTFSYEKTTLFAQELDYGQELELLVNSELDGLPTTFGFNAKFFLKVLKALESQKVDKFTMFFHSYNRGLLINFNSQFGFAKIFMMPIMLNLDNDNEFFNSKIYGSSSSQFNKLVEANKAKHTPQEVKNLAEFKPDQFTDKKVSISPTESDIKAQELLAEIESQVGSRYDSDNRHYYLRKLEELQTQGYDIGRITKSINQKVKELFDTKSKKDTPQEKYPFKYTRLELIEKDIQKAIDLVPFEDGTVYVEELQGVLLKDTPNLRQAFSLSNRWQFDSLIDKHLRLGYKIVKPAPLQIGDVITIISFIASGKRTRMQEFKVVKIVSQEKGQYRLAYPSGEEAVFTLSEGHYERVYSPKRFTNKSINSVAKQQLIALRPKLERL